MSIPERVVAGSHEPALEVARSGRPGLADWLDLLAFLRLDEGRADIELRRRDRAIGARLEGDASAPARQLVAWVRTLRAGNAAPDATSGVRTADSVAWGVAALGLAGLVLGASTALGAFSFQPQGRINVVAVFGLLVVLPTVFLLLALLNALPTRVRRMWPLLGSEPEGGGLLQPARWALRALPQSARETLESAWARGRAIERLTAPVQRWLLLSASQGASVAFQLGALATALGLVVFSDLSFGWSTTLDIGVEAAHRVTSVLSAPWASLWPEAVPSVELLEQTRFFRIAADRNPDVPPELFGDWWRFLLLAMALYGLLPRVAFFLFARSRLRRGLVRAMVDAPGARRLLSRMQDPLVETSSLGPGDRGHAMGELNARDREPMTDVDWPAQAIVVSWAEASEYARGEDAADTGPFDFAAGGRLTPADDLQAATNAAARARKANLPVAVVVRGFEPPVLEVLDFLAELRRALGDGRDIVVGLVEGDALHERSWRRKLASSGDPWLFCTAFAPGEAPPSNVAGEGAS